VGVGTWLGLLFGTLVKLVLSVVMVALAAGVWLLNL
jgi:tetrahydromethanopterin S-methyltransferase subunit G